MVSIFFYLSLFVFFCALFHVRLCSRLSQGTGQKRDVRPPRIPRYPVEFELGVVYPGTGVRSEKLPMMCDVSLNLDHFKDGSQVTLRGICRGWSSQRLESPGGRVRRT